MTTVMASKINVEYWFFLSSLNWENNGHNNDRLVTIRLSMLFYHRTCFLNLQFLNVGKVVCFSLFLPFVFVFCVFMGLQPSIEDK